MSSYSNCFWSIVLLLEVNDGHRKTKFEGKEPSLPAARRYLIGLLPSKSTDDCLWLIFAYLCHVNMSMYHVQYC